MQPKLYPLLHILTYYTKLGKFNSSEVTAVLLEFMSEKNFSLYEKELKYNPYIIVDYKNVVRR